MFLSASSSLTISRRAMGILQRLSLQCLTSLHNNKPEIHLFDGILQIAGPTDKDATARIADMLMKPHKY
jgi:hypothetical protein